MSLPRTGILMLAGTALTLPLLVSSGTTYAAAGDVWAVTKEANGPSTKPTVPDGGGRAFFSSSAKLVKGDGNGYADAYSVRRDGVVKKISSKAGGGNANGESTDVQVSADGRTVVFATKAWNLWNSDHNEKQDIYACTSSCFSVGWVAKGMEPNGSSYRPRISADGRWVVFTSDATNWVKGDTIGVRDVFLANVRNGVVTRVSVSSTGAQLKRPSDFAAISGDGKYVSFTTAEPLARHDTNRKPDVYLRDLSAKRTSLVSQSASESIGNGSSSSSTVANRCMDGKCFPTVVFTSTATNLVGNDTNGVRDVFIRERGSTARVSVSSAGVQGLAGEASWAPSISRDGRRVVFVSDADLTGVASDSAQVILRDRSDGSMKLLSQVAGVPGDGDSGAPSISPNGQYAAFVSLARNLDAVSTDNGTWDVFVATVF
jgi:Tol biopolymer transport system component